MLLRCLHDLIIRPGGGQLNDLVPVAAGVGLFRDVHKSAHAIAHVMKIAGQMNKDQIIIATVSGRGDKDVAAIARYRGVEIYE